MKTAIQTYESALAYATRIGVRPLGAKSNALYLTIDELRKMFAIEGFNVTSSKAWKGQIDTWQILGLANVSKINAILFRPEDGIVPDSPSIQSALKLVSSWSVTNGCDVVGWEV